MMNGHEDSDFDLLVSGKTRREVVRIRKDVTLQKALEPLLKKWGLNPNKVSYQLRYYQYDLKPGTLAGDTEGTEVYITKGSEPPDRELKGFHPFINKSSIKTCVEEYINRNGWYLTRESSSANGQFSLAVTFKNQLRHFKINFSPPDGTYKVASKPFDNLHDLFEYYQTHPIKTTPEGEIYLTHPIPQESKAENGPHPSIQSLPVSEEPKVSAQKDFKLSQSSRPLPPVPVQPSSPSPTASPPILPEKPALANHQEKKPPLANDQPKKPPLANHQEKKSLQTKESSVSKNDPNVNNTNPKINEKRNSKTLPHPKKVSKDLTPLTPLTSLTPPTSFTSRPLPPIPPPNEEKGNHLSNYRSILIPGSGHIPGNKLEEKSNPIPNGFHNPCDEEQWKHSNLSPVSNSPPRTSKPPAKPLPSNSNASISSQIKAPDVPIRNSKQTKQYNYQSIDPVQGMLRQKNSLPNPPVVLSGTGPPSDDTLPPNWVPVYSNSRERFYYFNHVTSETKWSHPLSGKEAVSNGVTNKPRPDSPSKVLADSGPVQYSRQRSNTIGTKPKPKNSPPPFAKSFSPLEKESNKILTRHVSNGIQGITRQNYSPEPSSPLEKVLNKSKPFRATENKTNVYDTLPEFESPPQSNPSPVPPPLNANYRIRRQAPPSPGYHSPPASSSNIVFPSNKKQPTNSASSRKDTSLKHSAPVNSVQSASLPQGKPVKVGKYTIPVPPPNIPSTNYTASSTPPGNRPSPKPAGKATTLPPRAALLDSIVNAANGKMLKPVAPVQPKKPKMDGTLFGVISRQMDVRKGMIQDSDDSDSSFEEADDDAWSVHNDN